MNRPLFFFFPTPLFRQGAWIYAMALFPFLLMFLSLQSMWATLSKLTFHSPAPGPGASYGASLTFLLLVWKSDDHTHLPGGCGASVSRTWPLVLLTVRDAPDLARQYFLSVWKTHSRHGESPGSTNSLRRQRPTCEQVSSLERLETSHFSLLISSTTSNCEMFFRGHVGRVCCQMQCWCPPHQCV